VKDLSIEGRDEHAKNRHRHHLERNEIISRRRRKRKSRKEEE